MKCYDALCNGSMKEKNSLSSDNDNSILSLVLSLKENSKHSKVNNNNNTDVSDTTMNAIDKKIRLFRHNNKDTEIDNMLMCAISKVRQEVEVNINNSMTIDTTDAEILCFRNYHRNNNTQVLLIVNKT